MSSLTASAEKLRAKLQQEEMAKMKAQLQVNESAKALLTVKEVIGAPGDVFSKARLFDAQLTKDGHLSNSKLIAFLVAQAAKMETALGAMRTLVNNFSESLPSSPETSQEKESSSPCYTDVSPKGWEEVG